MEEMKHIVGDITVVTVPQDDVGNDTAHDEEELLTINYRSGRWEGDETTKLVELWRNNVLSSVKKYKTIRIDKEIWKEISRELARAGMPRPPEQCQIRIKNLLQQCRYAKQADAHLGRSKDGKDSTVSPAAPLPSYMDMIYEVLQQKEQTHEADADKDPFSFPEKLAEKLGDGSPTKTAKYGKRSHDGARVSASAAEPRNGSLNHQPTNSSLGRGLGGHGSSTPVIAIPRSQDRPWRDRAAYHQPASGQREADVLRDVIRLQERQLERFYEIETKRLAYEQERLATDKTLARAIVEAAEIISDGLKAAVNNKKD